jgi:hypothetical protein
MISRHGRSERGASIVDGALASPIFFVLILGIFEFGLAFRDYLTLTSGTQSAARSASVEGRYAYTDYDILQAIRTGTAGLANSADIRSIVIFHASGPEATLANSGMSGCLTSSSSNCNSYTASDLTRPKTDFGCGSSAPDRYWCPSTRRDQLSGPPDFVGVHIAIRHHNPTGLFGTIKDFDDEVVMRIEPTAL